MSPGAGAVTTTERSANTVSPQVPDQCSSGLLDVECEYVQQTSEYLYWSFPTVELADTAVVMSVTVSVTFTYLPTSGNDRWVSWARWTFTEYYAP